MQSKQIVKFDIEVENPVFPVEMLYPLVAPGRS